MAQFVYATKANIPHYMVRNGMTYRIVSERPGGPRLVVNQASSP